MSKQVVKKIIRLYVQIFSIPIIPLLALGWWTAQDNNVTYWQSVKEVWKL